jgi:hypothetical protein
VTGNVFSGPTVHSVAGNGTAGARQTLARYAPDAVWSGNYLVGGSAAQYPSGNWFPASLAQVPSSAGADTARVRAATAGVVVAR